MGKVDFTPVANAPWIVGMGVGMNHCFAKATIRHSNGEVFVRAAKTALGMSLEMGQNQKGIIICGMGADAHFLEVFAAVEGKHRRSFFIQNIHGAESPTVLF